MNNNLFNSNFDDKTNKISFCIYGKNNNTFILGSGEKYNNIFSGQYFTIDSKILKNYENIEEQNIEIEDNGYIITIPNKTGHQIIIKNENKSYSYESSLFLLVPENYKFRSNEELINIWEDKRGEPLIDLVKKTKIALGVDASLK